MEPRQYVSRVTHIPPDFPLAIMDLAVGGLLVLGGDGRAQSLGFSTARQLAPIQGWGFAFLLLGSMLMLAIKLPTSDRWVGLVRVLGPSLCVMWASMYLISGLANDHVSFIGVPSYLYLAYRHSFAPTRPA